MLQGELQERFETLEMHRQNLDEARAEKAAVEEHLSALQMTMEEARVEVTSRERERRMEVVRRAVGRISHAGLTHVFDAWSIGAQKQKEARHRLEVGQRVVARMLHAEM